MHVARDLIHTIIRQALEKDGWIVTHDPYPLKVDGFDMEVDLAAEGVMAAERGTEQVAVEIKTFAQMVIAELKMKLLVVNLEKIEVLKWIN